MLVTTEQKSQEHFDKTVLSLSGGALGISFIFLKDVIGSNPIVSHGYLLAAWILWALSSFAVLLSFFLSQLALRYAVKQVDKGKIRSQKPGGSYSTLTAILNPSGALFFLIGVICITIFAGENLSDKGDTNVRKGTTNTSQTAINTSQTATNTSQTAINTEQKD